MTVLKVQGYEAFLRRPDPGVAVLLIYGEEQDAVRELAGRAVKRVAGSLDDPFAVVKLDDRDLAGDPARLIDEVRSLSMLGGNRAIWIKGADQNFLKAVAPVLDGKVAGNFIIAESGLLAKSSALRNALEKSPKAAIMPLYEAEDSDLSAALDLVLGKDKLSIEPDARYRFLEFAGSSRGLLQREAEKLAIYAMGQSVVTLADVDAVCGNGAEPGIDELADAAFTGESAEVDRCFQIMIQAGMDAGRLVSATHLHALRLQDFKLAIARGATADQVLKSAKPPIFFRRVGVIHTQLKLWSLPALLSAATSLAGAIQQVRHTAGLGESIASRVLLAIARNGRALRAERN